jgi:tetratricopeptide (TPR) repeat protein
MRLAIVLVCVTYAAGALAQDGGVCPPVADHSAEIAALINEIRAAPNAASARPLSDSLWQIWTDAPDEKAQAMLDEGMRKRSSYDFLGARDVLDGLVDYCPDYAEGYNQRAFASYLRGDYAAALVDLDRALAILPNHVAAMSGKALTLIGLGRNDEAQEVLRQAVALNPWLSERALLVEKPGQDI